MGETWHLGKESPTLPARIRETQIPACSDLAVSWGGGRGTQQTGPIRCAAPQEGCVGGPSPDPPLPGTREGLLEKGR